MQHRRADAPLPTGHAIDIKGDAPIETGGGANLSKRLRIIVDGEWSRKQDRISTSKSDSREVMEFAFLGGLVRNILSISGVICALLDTERAGNAILPFLEYASSDFTESGILLDVFPDLY